MSELVQKLVGSWLCVFSPLLAAISVAVVMDLKSSVMVMCERFSTANLRQPWHVHRR